MSTDPQTAEQSKGEWMLTGPIYGSGPTCCYTAEEHWFVSIPDDFTRADIEAAMRDPSRVLNVSAYPEVVEAMEPTLVNEEGETFGLEGIARVLLEHGEAGAASVVMQYLDSFRAALSHVHPADRDKI